jgi:hypothetical protein
MNTFSPSIAKFAITAALLSPISSSASYIPDGHIVKKSGEMTSEQMCRDQGGRITRQLSEFIHARYADILARAENMGISLIFDTTQNVYILKIDAHNPDGSTSLISEDLVNVDMEPPIQSMYAVMEKD